MNLDKSLHTVELLAQGIDPRTGEYLPPSHLLQDSEIIRSLHAAVQALREVSRKKERKKTLPTRAGAAWSAAEDRDLIAAYEAGAPEAEIAAKFQRSTGAIRSRLMRLGFLQFPEAEVG